MQPPTRNRPSPNHGPRPPGASVDMLVVHYTEMATAEAAIQWLCNPQSRVSAHYLIDEAGGVHAMVGEDRRAWHAGVAHWRGITDVNAHSIGIELANPGHGLGYRDFAEPQITALIALCRGILARHPIPARNVVGHSDVAHSRKRDPGERFPWPRLAAAGIGLWPAETEAAAADADITEMLTAYGYGVDQPLATVVTAFQRHFRPDRVDGVADAETLGKLRSLLARAGIVAPGAATA